MNTTSINGVIALKQHHYAIKNFMDPNREPIPIGTLAFDDYTNAIVALAGKVYPRSFYPYLLAVRELTPDEDTWNNLIFTGHAEGTYDNEEHRFRSALSQGMDSTTREQQAYVAALISTYNSILDMIEK